MLSQHGKMDCCEICVFHLIGGLRIHAHTGMKPCGFLMDVFWACELSHWFDFSGACGPLGGGVGRGTKSGEHMLLAFTLRTLENIPREKCETLSG